MKPIKINRNRIQFQLISKLISMKNIFLCIWSYLLKGGYEVGWSSIRAPGKKQMALT